LPDAVEQRNTILNLYESGIDPEIIGLELDITTDSVLEVIENENKKEKGGSANNISNSLLNIQNHHQNTDAVIDITSMIKESQTRMWKALRSKPDFNTSSRKTHGVLEKCAGSKINLIVLHIDLVGSTRMSLSLPIDRLTTIIRSFVQEMSLVVSAYGGYVLKYIGDAVLVFFVMGDSMDGGEKDANTGPESSDSHNGVYLLHYNNAISCAYTMIKVIQEGIDPILNQYDYPELKVRIGMDFGEVAVVQYGMDVEEIKKTVIKKPRLDLIGYAVGLAIKMTSLAKPDHIVIGQKLYDKLDVKHRSEFRQLPENPDIWDYANEATGKIYDLYGNN
jgi:class 3 adenylate cyclase